MADWTITLHDKMITTFSITEGQTITIGRGKECDVTIDNTAVSRQHVSLSLNSGIFFVSDMGSTNGTFVNGKRVTTDEPVSENDAIEFGKFTMRSSLAEESVDRLASSASADLGMDDETIFVTKKREAPSPQRKQFKPNEGPRLRVIQGEGFPVELPLSGKNSVKIGKHPSCDITITGWFIAEAQCYIIKRDDNYFIVPQKSWASTLINNQKISVETQLRKDDVIKIRSNMIRFD